VKEPLPPVFLRKVAVKVLLLSVPVPVKFNVTRESDKFICPHAAFNTT
jgi:hypothetical protein